MVIGTLISRMPATECRPSKTRVGKGLGGSGRVPLNEPRGSWCDGSRNFGRCSLPRKIASMNEAPSRCVLGLLALIGLSAVGGCTSSSSEQWAQTAPVIKADVVNTDEPVTLGMRGDNRSTDQNP